MLQQATLWQFLKRDASSLQDGGEETVPGPKRVKSSSNLLDASGSAGFTRLRAASMSTRTSSRNVSSPALSRMDCDESQLILDCGQKRFGPEVCSVCGMFYSPVNGEDAAVHERYHRQLSTPTRFIRRLCNGTLFVCVQEYEDGSIYKCWLDCDAVRRDKNGCRAAIRDVCAKMTDELGQSTARSFDDSLDKDGRQLYVFVGRPDQTVYGVLIVDHLKFAYRCHADGQVDDQPNAAAMGVNRVWTWAGARRRGVATRLVDCARCNFFFGAPILKKHVAFSDPTPAGLEFAKKYCQSESVLVYRFV